MSLILNKASRIADKSSYLFSTDRTYIKVNSATNFLNKATSTKNSDFIRGIFSGRNDLNKFRRKIGNYVDFTKVI